MQFRDARGRRKRCTLWECCCYRPRLLWLTVLAIIFLLQGHHILCYFSVHACFNPFLRLLVSANTMDPILDAPIPVQFKCPAGVKEEQKISRLLLLAHPKSGSSWIREKLNSLEVHIGDEVLLRFHQDCHAKSGCGWEDTKKVLEASFQDLEMKKAHTNTKYIGFKIQYQHIKPSMREAFANWVSCNNVTIVHLIRSASIESFISMQMEALDYMKTGQLRIRDRSSGNLAKELPSNYMNGIDIVPSKARRFVDGVESERAYFRHILKYLDPAIEYYEIYYEQLLRDPQRYLFALQTFLGVRNYLGPDTLARIHPGRCSSKIKNWEAVRKALRGTESYYACN